MPMKNEAQNPEDSELFYIHRMDKYLVSIWIDEFTIHSIFQRAVPPGVIGELTIVLPIYSSKTIYQS